MKLSANKECCKDLGVFATKADSTKWNIRKLLLESGYPPTNLFIDASHSSHIGANASDDAAGNLSRQLVVSLGARIVLRENLDIARGLINNSFGTIHEINWHGSNWEYGPLNPRETTPDCLYVTFDRYSGRPDWVDDKGHPLIPLFTSLRQFHYDGHNCERSQFPISAAFGITAYKAQGITTLPAGKVASASNSS
ncbi:uncharacterized protein N7515_004958 [Penicillium bovifimosum]|uniref:Uncharacterized protein n=1 Tax=Penicillium bovifimosum TaxID=126998 RepID=A0A9W9H1D8_9EURO|nr:uncharacterized protein N7515_004958 [Penicillium bovifimosum]KAJ5135680.1 hypothetical protein N7515_004958 [Penicillium bovifimosum]